MDGFGGVGADGGRQSPSTTPSPPPGAIQLQVSPPGRRPLGQQQTQQQQQPMTDGAGPSPSYYASLAPYETFDEEDAAVGAAVGGGQQHQQQAPAASAAERSPFLPQPPTAPPPAQASSSSGLSSLSGALGRIRTGSGASIGSVGTGDGSIGGRGRLGSKGGAATSARQSQYSQLQQPLISSPAPSAGSPAPPLSPSPPSIPAASQGAPSFASRLSISGSGSGTGGLAGLLASPGAAEVMERARAAAAAMPSLDTVAEWVDPDRHVERGPYHGKTYPDSLTYEPEESEVWRTHELQRVYREQSRFWTTGKRRALKRWLLTALLGVLIGCIGVGMTYATGRLVGYKFRTVTALLDAEVHGRRIPGGSFFWYWLLNCAYALVANLTVLIEPVAAGSGIPEIKAFLNGVSLPRVVRVKTMLCKMVGVVFTVAAGLPAGKEGPMVHIGSVVAAGVSQGRSSFWGIDTSFSRFQDFRNDREKRDFVSCGAASGVASAFGAPIGGVLFSLEEGASFWSSKLTYRAFLSAMLTAITLLTIKTAEGYWGSVRDSTKMFSFGKFASSGVNYSVWEIALFLLIGCLGGLIGAGFNALNERLTRWRMLRMRTVRDKCLEVLAVASAMTFLSFLLPLMWRKCTPLPSDAETEGWTEPEKTLLTQLVPFQCTRGTHYNELASLFFTDADTAIRQLFHFRESGSDNHPSFSAGALFLFFVPYIAMAIVSYGTAVPSGLFVPSLLSGAAFGRLFGHVLHRMDHTSGTFADTGTYALVGAAAVLGGMARMTISLSVILLEATGDMQYVLPLMATLMAARWVGNLFNEGLYDIHIRLKGYPVLEPDMPPAARKHMTAAQIMSRDPIAFRRVERVGHIYDVLQSCEHDCFPVLNAEEGGVLVGTVLRKALCVILQHKAFSHPDAAGPEALESRAREGRLLSPLLNWTTLEKVYPRYPHIRDIRITERDRQCVIDLRSFMSTAPYVINESASLVRTYRLFRTMGLRHLCVLNSHNQATGIITRVDLLPESLRAKYVLVSRQAAEAGRSYYARRRSPYQIPPEWTQEEEDEEEGEGGRGGRPGGRGRRRSLLGSVDGVGVAEEDEDEEEEDGEQMRVL